MKNIIQLTVLYIFGFLCSLNIVAQDKTVITQNYIKTDTTIESVESQYPFFTFEYLITSSQVPASKQHDLSSMKTNFSVFSTELNYGWYLDKQKGKSILLASFGYRYIKSNTSETSANKDIPYYILKIPNLHQFNFAVIYNQKLIKQWELIASASTSVINDLKHSLSDDDYNITVFAYGQKQIKNFKIGAGCASYLIGNSVKALPVGLIGYRNNKLEFELLMPVSFKANYKFHERNMFQFISNLNFSGYSVYTKEASIVQQPDYADITDFDMRFSFDRIIADNLHLNVGLGYWNREIKFLKKNNVVDNLNFNESIFLSGKMYYTF